LPSTGLLEGKKAEQKSVGNYKYQIDVLVKFEVFTEVTMKNAVSWDVTPCGSYKNRRLEGIYRIHHQGDKNRRSGANVSSN
jgi:hypothetical protein